MLTTRKTIQEAVDEIKKAPVGQSVRIGESVFSLTKIKTPQTDWAAVLHEDGEGDFTKALFIPSSEFDIKGRAEEAVVSFLETVPF